MSGKTIAWVTAVATLVAFLLIALLLHLLLDLSTGERWLLWVSFIVLGMVAAGLVAWSLLARARRAGGDSVGDDELDALFSQARRHLGAARAGSRVGQMPVILLLGPSGASKTTLMIRSGLEPELLAGEVHRGETVVSTGAANVWYAQNAVFVEAGGTLLGESNRWRRLLRHIQPSRLAAVFSRAAQAPRVAVVCFPCDDLVRSGGGESVIANARRLRGRLVEMSQQLGIRLPIYVMFTKADRLPYFADYLRSFTRSESAEVLGVTMPVAQASGGSYAERQSSRLSSAFGSMFKSLALRRLEVLPREAQEETRSGAYEFPREFRKISELATQFMVDLCRPSQLSVSPFLRGFYFTGVRPVVVSDSGAARAEPSSSGSVPVDATGVFDARALKQAAAAGPAQAGGARRVPEWAFLKRVFSEVILGDRAAHEVTGGGTRLNMLRRSLLAAAAIVLLITAIGMTVSFGRNASLSGDVRFAAAGVETIDLSTTGVPALDALQRLDSLGQQIDVLRTFAEDGAPLSMRWFLFAGDDLLEQARRVYFDRFGRLLWAGARVELLGYLGNLPVQPNEASQYDATYEALKAHLVTTSHTQESTADFLAPVLFEYWSLGRAPADEHAALARAQFARFGRELPYGNPYGERADEALVARTRAFLAQFGDADRLYQATLASAANIGESISFDARYPQDVVQAPYIVPPAFTPPAHGRVMEDLNDLDRLFERESWVVGDQTVAPGDRVQLARDLRVRYEADYIRHWQEYLAAANVTPFNSLIEAARKLERVGSNQSPVLQFLSLAAQYTAVDSTSDIARAFAPVQIVTPAHQGQTLINDRNRPYTNALVALQSALDNAASAPVSGRSGALANAQGSVEQGRVAVSQIASEFPFGADATNVGNTVQRLLLQPLIAAENLIGGVPVADLNQRGATFCRAFNPVLAKYPFNARSSEEAGIDEVAAMFKPNASALSDLISSMQSLLNEQGNGYAAAPDAQPRPQSAFINALNRAVAAQNTFYSGPGQDPTIDFSLRMHTTDRVSRVSFWLDGRVQHYEPTQSGMYPFRWNGAQSTFASIIAVVDGEERTVLQENDSPWAIFRVLEAATWERGNGGGWNLVWRVPGLPVTFSGEITLPSGLAPIFEPGWLSQLACVSRIAS